MFKKKTKKPEVKFNTDSKLTRIITGKEKLKIPNPVKGLKNIKNALKPKESFTKSLKDAVPNSKKIQKKLEN